MTSYMGRYDVMVAIIVFFYRKLFIEWTVLIINGRCKSSRGKYVYWYWRVHINVKCKALYFLFTFKKRLKRECFYFGYFLFISFFLDFFLKGRNVCFSDFFGAIFTPLYGSIVYIRRQCTCNNEFNSYK